MTISYLARIPDKTSLWFTTAATVYRQPPGDKPSIRGNRDWFPSEPSPYLIGRFGDTVRDVCADFYRPVSERLRPKPKLAPYSELVNCDDDLEAIVEFTKKWGLLTSNEILPSNLRD